MVKASASRGAHLDSISTFTVDLCPGRVIPGTYELVLQWLPCHAPGVIGSALGLVDSVSVNCDWVREQV